MLREASPCQAPVRVFARKYTGSRLEGKCEVLMANVEITYGHYLELTGHSIVYSAFASYWLDLSTGIGTLNPKETFAGVLSGHMSL